MHIIQRILSDVYDCRAYSGRGMNGKKCLGVDIGTDSIGAAMAEIFFRLRSRDEETHDGVANAFRLMRTDSLGQGTIVYFPGVEFTE